MKIRKRTFSGTLSEEESAREREHRKIARRAAAEGMVLLENDGVLPLKPGAKIALYGFGARHTIKGGTGSGAVNNRSAVSIDEGLRGAGFTVTTDDWLDEYDARYEAEREAWIESVYRIAGGREDFEALYRAHSANPMKAPAGKEITPEDKTDTDIAVYVISRVSGEGADRFVKEGDYYLSETEFRELKNITTIYEKTVVILNTGGIMDLSFLDEVKTAALVYMSQAGMEGGSALADILSGRVNPSGKLTDTWAYAYEDYPGSRDYSHNNGNLFEEKYAEGIYVGYRYFDSFGVRPRYPFGFGRSYTEFALRVHSFALDGAKVCMQVQVKNTGGAAGREVVQVYAACPRGHLKKEQKRLVAFGKSACLEPGEEAIVALDFELSALESYWAGRASYYLDPGRYYILVGTSGEQTRMAACLTLREPAAAAEGSSGETLREPGYTMRKLTNICPLQVSLAEIEPSDERISEWEAEYAADALAQRVPVIPMDEAVCAVQAGQGRERGANSAGQSRECGGNPCRNEAVRAVQAGQDQGHGGAPAGDKDEAERIAERLTLSEKATLVCGRVKDGTAEVIGNASITVPGAAGETTRILEDPYQVGSIILADGPAGLRLQQCYEENPADGSIYALSRIEALENRIFQKTFPHPGAIRHYQFCSAIPIGTLLAQSFDMELLREVGEMIGREMEEFGVTLWLAPGLNIHRNPLCGRNYEYYSEDPLVSGAMAAAITQGVQRLPGLGTTIKHFACNNQEDNRFGMDSIVSERALREIYLKGFEIAVKTARPAAIMTSYNKLNAVHTANSYDLCTTVARGEWGFEGIIMTDWSTTNGGHGSSAARCISAGNDLVMPGRTSDIQEIIDAVRAEKHLCLDERDLTACAARIIRLILASNIYEEA